MKKMKKISLRNVTNVYAAGLKDLVCFDLKQINK